MRNKAKKESADYSYKAIRKIKRKDGLRMKTVRKYTFPGFVEAVSSRWPDRLCYSVFREEGSEMTFSHLKAYSRSVALYLIKQGIKKGDKIAIYAESAPNWMVMYLGIVYFGAIAVPILPDFATQEAINILTDSGAKGILVNSKSFQKIGEYALSHGIFVYRIEDLMHIEEVKEGFSYLTTPAFPMKGLKTKDDDLKPFEVKEEDIASIIYTSGTTGTSKGVVLTHINMLRNADWSTDEYVKIMPGYRVLSILPMSHVYEFTLGNILTLMRGAHITFLGKPPAVSILLPALKEVRPHIMVSVPLLIEKIYRAAILPVIRDNQKIKRLLKTPLRFYIFRAMGNKLMSTFGNRVKFFGIGGAPLDKEVEIFLHKAHFPYAIGYGLTETSPLIAGCAPVHKSQKPGTVGPVVEDDHVKLLNRNEEGIGEIAVKGVNVMGGYYNNPALNKESFTEDGYFKTGDLGKLDKRNRLSIKGRVKTMILGPGGENIYPESIESLINNMNFVEESLVIPEDGGLLALIKLDMKSFQDKLKVSVDDLKEEAKKYLSILKKDVNSQLSSFSKIDDVELLEEDFERTPTQKIKRFIYSSSERGRVENINNRDSEKDKRAEKDLERGMESALKEDKRIERGEEREEERGEKRSRADDLKAIKTNYLSDLQDKKRLYSSEFSRLEAKRLSGLDEIKREKERLKSEYENSVKEIRKNYREAKRKIK